MFPDPAHIPFKPDRRLQPDRRPLPRSSEIRLRVKRAMHRGEV